MPGSQELIVSKNLFLLAIRDTLKTRRANSGRVEGEKANEGDEIGVSPAAKLELRSVGPCVFIPSSISSLGGRSRMVHPEAARRMVKMSLEGRGVFVASCQGNSLIRRSVVAISCAAFCSHFSAKARPRTTPVAFLNRRWRCALLSLSARAQSSLLPSGSASINWTSLRRRKSPSRVCTSHAMLNFDDDLPDEG